MPSFLSPFLKQSTATEHIAVLYANGDIVDTGEGGIVGDVMTPQILDLAKDDNVKGLVLRVNSGGGSAFASEQIWNALETFKATGKPFYGVCASHGGLKRWLWPMVTAISLPNIVYVIMAYLHPELWIVNALIFIEQFGYGFGFTAYMLFLIHYAEGESTTAHYALCTAFMAMGMMIPGMAAGWLQELLGYQHFFILICILCLVTVGVCCFIKLDKPTNKKSYE